MELSKSFFLLMIPQISGLIILSPDLNTNGDIQFEHLPDIHEDLNTLLDLVKSENFDDTVQTFVPREPGVLYGDMKFRDSYDEAERDGIWRDVSNNKQREDDERLAKLKNIYSEVVNNIPFEHEDNLLEKFTERRRRSTRALPQRINARVEVLVVVDNAIYREYLKKSRNQQREALAMVRQYYGMVFAMVDQRFQTVRDNQLSITVKISGILVAEVREDSPWVEYIVSHSRDPTKPGRVNANRALKKFQKWLLSQKNLPKYDHAMTFTRYQLINRLSIDLGGLAYVKSVCHIADASSSSIVSDPGDFQCVKVAAHELGHSLGATHDGDKKNPSCPPNDNFVMAPQTTNEQDKLKNAFYFSRCSISQMNRFLRTEQAKCVYDSPAIYYHYDLERRPPGQIYSADNQCKLIFGKKSSFCDTGKMQSVMCGQLWCKDPKDGRTCRTHSYLTALPGTECSKGQVCHLGVCTPDRTSIHYQQQLKSSRNLNTGKWAGSGQLETVREDNTPTFQLQTPTFNTHITSHRKNTVRGTNQDMARNIARSRMQRPNGQQSRQRGRLQRPVIGLDGRRIRPMYRLRGRRPSNRSRSNRRRGERRRLTRRQRIARNRTRNQSCKGDQNTDYCEGLIKLNPRGCRKRPIRRYCCKTCSRRR